jgi:hypothetical protein
LDKIQDESKKEAEADPVQLKVHYDNRGYPKEASKMKSDFKSVTSQIQRLMNKNKRVREKIIKEKSNDVVYNPGKKHSVTESVDMLALLASCCDGQDWHNVASVKIAGFGRGLMALQDFKKNDVIVDYHGKETKNCTWEEYEKRPNVNPEYCLQVKGPHRRIIDATNVQCGGHNGAQCLGRLVNHAPSNSGPCNAKAVDFRRTIEGNLLSYVILVARRDIKMFEQIRFDYNDPVAHELFD